MLKTLTLAVLTLAAGDALAAPARRIVVFSSATPPAQRLAIALASGGRVVHELSLIDAVAVEAPEAVLAAAEVSLKGRPEVLRIDEDPRLNWLGSAAPAALPDFALPEPGAVIAPFRASPRAAPAPEGQELPWGIKRVNAPAAWAKSRGEGVKVAVIDTGIDPAHPDLKANVAGGWNATDAKKREDFMDDNGHGTHCAGTVAAADDAQGVVGVAPSARLYGVKVLDKDGSGTFSDVIAGMQWAVQHRMQVASMSLGASRGNDSLKAAVAAMAKAGVVLVAAAGNSGKAVGFPAAYPEAIAVAALDSSDKVAYFSSRGPEVALIAPGVAVRSTSPGGTYDTHSGTSMATPHVSGLAALALAGRGLAPAGVRAALKAAAAPLKEVPVEQQGAGVVDAAKLLNP